VARQKKETNMKNKVRNIGLLAIFLLVGCTSTQVLDDINVGIDVGTQILSIISQTPGTSADIQSGLQTASNIFTEAKRDLSDGENWYNQWKTATDAQTKASLAQQIENTVNTAQTNMAGMLADAHVKNTSLIGHITDAASIINTGLTVLLNAVNPNASLVRASRIPIVSGAKKAKDLRNVWNKSIEKDYPKNKI
jgi:hypothetical protein